MTAYLRNADLGERLSPPHSGASAIESTRDTVAGVGSVEHPMPLDGPRWR